MKLRFELLTHTDEPARGSPLPQKKPHAKFAKSAKKWKAVMKRAQRAELRSSPKANQKD